MNNRKNTLSDPAPPPPWLSAVNSEGNRFSSVNIVDWIWRRDSVREKLMAVIAPEEGSFWKYRAT